MSTSIFIEEVLPEDIVQDELNESRIDPNLLQRVREELANPTEITEQAVRDERAAKREESGFFNFAKLAYNRSITGTLERAITGKEPFDLSDFEPSFIEDVAATIVSFFMPVDLVATATGFKVGALIAGRASQAIFTNTAKQLVARGVAPKVASRAAAIGTRKAIATSSKAIQMGIGLGAFGAAQSSAFQLAETGEIDLGEAVMAGLESSIIGAVSGGVGGAIAARTGGVVRPLAGEIAAFGTMGPIVEGRRPTMKDYGHAAGVMIGLKAFATLLPSKKIDRDISFDRRQQYRKVLSDEIRRKVEVEGKPFEQAVEETARQDAKWMEQAELAPDGLGSKTNAEIATIDRIMKGEEILKQVVVERPERGDVESAEIGILKWSGDMNVGTVLADRVALDAGKFMAAEKIARDTATQRRINIFRQEGPQSAELPKGVGRPRFEIVEGTGDKPFKTIDRANNDKQVGQSATREKAERFILNKLQGKENVRKATPREEAMAKEPVTLTDAEQMVADWANSIFNVLGDLAQEADVLGPMRERYVHQIIKGTPEQKANALNAIKQTGLPEVPGFAKPQEFSIRELEKLGFEVIHDIPTQLFHWITSYYKAVANKNLIKFLRETPTNSDLPIVSGVQLSGYIPLKLRGFRVTETVIDPLTKEPKVVNREANYVHPSFIDTLKAVVDPNSTVGQMENAMNKIRFGVRRIIMYNPMIHGWNIFSDVLDEVNFNFVKATKTVLGGGEKMSKLTKMARVNSKFELHMDMAKNSISMRALNEAQAGLESMMTETMPELNSGIGRLKHAMKGIRNWNDRVLWGSIVGHSQELIYAMKKDLFIKNRGLSDSDAGRLAAHFTNDLLGTLPQITFTAGQSRLLNSMFFARNWTISNIRLLTGAIGARNSKLPRFLNHKGVSREEMKILQQEYQKHLAKGMVGMVVLANMVNLAVTGKLAIDNEEGHRLDIDTGQFDNKGRRIYLAPPFFRYMNDYLHWFSDPARTLWNKGEPVARQMIEQLINHEVWSGRTIAPQGAPFNDKVLLRLEKTIRDLTPVGTLTARKGQVRTWLEVGVPATGTWVRRGLAGGDIRLKLMDFRTVKKYERDKLDLELDEMIQSGDISGFAHEAIASGRFVDVQQMIDRLIRFKSPIIYNWRTMAVRDRTEFILTLSPGERRQLAKALGGKL